MGILKENINGKLIEVDVESSNLDKAVYNTETKNLRVTFKTGNIYEYDDVPWDVFTKFRMAESQGKYFNANISRKYTYKKIQ